MSRVVKIAAIQMNPVLMNTVKNMASVEKAILEAAEKQADLLVDLSLNRKM